MNASSDSTETSRLIISMNESLLEKQEYTKDGAVDVFGMPASISKTGGMRAAFFVLASTVFTALAYGGVYINLVLYLKGSVKEDSASAAITVNSLTGFGYVVSLFGAVIGDGYLGRYWSGALFLVIYLMGSIAVSILNYLPAFSSDCTTVLPKCLHPSLKFLFFIFLYISALGLGGSQPCVTALGADQFDDSIEEEKAHKLAFFNWYYIFYNTGVMLANIVIVYVEENHGYALGFALSTGALGLAVGFFLLGIPIYRLQRPVGNPFLRVVQVIVATIRKWHVQAPMGNLLHELHDDVYHIQGTRKILYSKRFRCLDKAATLIPNEMVGETYQSAWRLCTVTQVEELKCLLSVLPVWIAIFFYGAMSAQMNSLFVEQSAMMDTHIGKLVFPTTYIFLCELISVFIWAIIYEKIIQPIARRTSGQTRGLTSLQRIGTGLIFTMLSMAAAALVEKFRRNIALSFILNLETGKPSQMSVLWQIPQYVLMGASEVFTDIGQMEFFYDQAPDALRGVGSALSVIALAGGSYLGSSMISITDAATRTKDSPGWIPNDLNKGRLDAFFWVLSFLCLLNFLYFLICAQFYEYIKVDIGDAENI